MVIIPDFLVVSGCSENDFTAVIIRAVTDILAEIAAFSASVRYTGGVDKP